MKSFALVLGILAFLACGQVHAGASGCTYVTRQGWSQADAAAGPTALAPNQCAIDAYQTDAGNSTTNYSLTFALPPNPNDGDTFTAVDTSDFSVDVCSTWYSDPSWGGDGNTYSGCQPGGLGFESPTDNVDGYAPSNGTTYAEFYFSTCDVGNVNPGSSPCGPGDLPSYWGDFPKVRYKVNATYSTAAGGWTTGSAPNSP